MAKRLTLEDLQNIDFDEDELVKDRSGYRNYSKKNAVIIGYLLGVKDEYLELIPNETSEYLELKKEIEKNDSARIIRHLNNIRSNLILGFKTVSKTIRIDSPDYKPLYKMEFFEEDFRELKKSGLDITTGRSDINEYLKKINEEISKQLDNIKTLFPEWIVFKHIKTAFIMPSNIEVESKKFQANQNCYPYKRYFNWKYPEEKGNILATDEKILDVLYSNNGDYFTDSDKVIGASDRVKNSINEFIQNGQRVQIFIDGENTDPYRFAAAIDSLSDDEIDKIEKIVVYYDSIFTSKAWTMLKHFVFDIEVEAIGVERLMEDKSLVDHKLVAGVSKAVYKDCVDSIILCSSDSDFWSVIEEVEAKYLVMVESEKCSYDFKEVLREHNIFYCYLDRFQAPSDNKYFKMVFRKELQNELEESFNQLKINANDLMKTAIVQSRAYISDQEKENIYKQYIKGLTLKIGIDGILKIEVPE